MTTGLIGIPGAVATRGRVAVVAREDARELVEILGQAGHEHEEFADWSEFRASCASQEWDLVLCGTQAVRSAPADVEVPGLLVGDGDAEVDASLLHEVLEPLLGMAAQLRLERIERKRLERFVDGLSTGEVFVGRCPVTRRVQGAIRRAAASDTTVLIEGPVGSGKSLAARIIHCSSRRAGRPPHVVQCAAVEPQAMADLLAAACGNTLVLEDIDQLPAASQSVLVKHLKERSGTHCGDLPRIVATTSARLPELIAKGVIREDLYYRLNAFPVVMPALRERPEDVRDLAEAILRVAAAHNGRAANGFTAAALVALESMHWSGNVAQLAAVVKRAHTLSGGAPIDREHVVGASPEPKADVGPGPQTRPEGRDSDHEVGEDEIRPFEEEEQHLLSRALRATKGNVRRAAQLLGIGRATLYRKIQQYKLRMQ